MKSKDQIKNTNKRLLTKIAFKHKLPASQSTFSYSSSGKIRSIGNSRGVILNNRILEEAGISTESNVLIHASKGAIIIMEEKTNSAANTDLSTWETQFKKAKSQKPDADLWGDIKNEFDLEEWK
jgi:hypothetical protein